VDEVHWPLVLLVLAILAHVIIFIDLPSCRILESVSPIRLRAFNPERCSAPPLEP